MSTQKSTIYIGGLDQAVTADLLHATFIPFGNILDIRIQYETGHRPGHRGFAYLEYEDPDDALAAIDNMHLGELHGNVLKVNLARVVPVQEGSTAKAVWETDKFMLEQVISKGQVESASDTIMADANDASKESSVFLDIRIGDAPPKRITILLRDNIAPKCAENFRQLCTHGKGFGFKSSIFHRIIPGFMAQGGDFERGDGTGGRSIYGVKFADENFTLKHNARGILSMANSGPDSNGSQFFILFGAADWLDGKHTIFGRIVDGMNVLDDMEKCGTSSGTPTKRIVIVDSGKFE